MKPDYDGRRFGFPGAGPHASFRDVLRWTMTRRKAIWPNVIPNPPGDAVVPRVGAGALRVTFVNHATTLIQCDGLNILTDPVWAQRVSPFRFVGPARHRAAGIAFDALPSIDAVLLSHNHYDHMDLATLGHLRKRDNPRFIVPLRNARYLEDGADTVELDWWGETTLSQGRSDSPAQATTATLVPARHWSSRRPGDANAALWGGYVIRSSSGAIYFAGDTGYGDGEHFHEARRRLGPFRFAMIPIGAYEPRWFMKPQHMNPHEAVQAFVDLDVEQAMGIHFGTFQLTDEAHDAPVTALRQALAEHRLCNDAFRVLENGQAWQVWRR